MALTTTTFRMDSTIKEELRELLEELGMDMSTYFVIAAKQAVREQGIPFKVTLDIPNIETFQAMENTKNRVGLSRGFTSVAELMEDLNADD